MWHILQPSLDMLEYTAWPPAVQGMSFWRCLHIWENIRRHIPPQYVRAPAVLGVFFYLIPALPRHLGIYFRPPTVLRRWVWICLHIREPIPPFRHHFGIYSRPSTGLRMSRRICFWETTPALLQPFGIYFWHL